MDPEAALIAVVEAIAPELRERTIAGVRLASRTRLEAIDLCAKAGIDCIFLLAPTSTDARIREVARAGTGYLYYVSLKGVTGVKSADTADVAAHLPKIRAISRLPIGVGFGIRDAESARAISKTADAVIIGSRIVQEIESAGPAHAVARVKALLLPIRQAMDS